MDLAIDEHHRHVQPPGIKVVDAGRWCAGGDKGEVAGRLPRMPGSAELHSARKKQPATAGFLDVPAFN